MITLMNTGSSWELLPLAPTDSRFVTVTYVNKSAIEKIAKHAIYQRCRLLV